MQKKVAYISVITVVLVTAHLAGAQSQLLWDFDQENLFYNFSWSGIVAAELRATIEKKDGVYHLSIDARTKPAIDVLWKMRDRLTVTTTSDLSPRYYQFIIREGKYQMDVEIKFDPQTNIATGKRYNPKRDRTYTRIVEMKDIYDPISAILFIRRQPLNLNDVYRIKVFDGRRLYDLKYEVVGRQKIKTYRGELWTKAVVPSLEPTSEKPEDVTKRVSKVLMYLAEDEPHDIVHIESDVFIGKVKVRLVSRTGGKPMTQQAQTEQMQKYMLYETRVPALWKNVLIGELSGGK